VLPGLKRDDFCTYEYSQGNQRPGEHGLDSLGSTDLNLGALLLRAIELLPPSSRNSNEVDEHVSTTTPDRYESDEIEMAHEALADTNSSDLGENQPPCNDDPVSTAVADADTLHDEYTHPIEQAQVPAPPPLPAPSNASRRYDFSDHPSAPDAASIATAAALIISKRRMNEPREQSSSSRNDEDVQTRYKKPESADGVDSKPATADQALHRDLDLQSDTKKSVSIDRDKIANILKKYSLYDDDDDDEDEDSED